MSLTIRFCCETDLPALHRLYRQLHPADTTTVAELARGFRAMNGQPGCQVYVAEHNGEVVGTFALYLLPNMTHNGRLAAVLENIVVDEMHRGKGIGRTMLEVARTLAAEHSCYKLSLTSNAARESAHAFYRRCGMMQHGLSFRFEL